MAIRRRDILRGSSAGLAALGLAQRTTAQNECGAAATHAATFVLVHGGWERLKPTYIHCVGQTYRKSSDLMVGPARRPD